MARHDQPEPSTTKEKTRRQTHRSISHHIEERSFSVYLETPLNLAHTSHIQRITSYPIHTTPCSLTKNNRFHLPQTSSTAKNTTKSRKYSTAENTKSEERLENPGDGLQTTSSSGKATDQNRTPGYERTTWTPMNSSTTTSPNT